MDDGVLLGLQFVRGRFELVLGRNQSAVHFVVGQLQIGDPVFVGRLHLLIAMVLGRDDAILEDDVDGREGDPAEEDKREPGKRRLQRRPKGEELHPAIAPNINLTFWKGFVKPRPDALHERFRHLWTSLFGVTLCADPY